MADDWIVPGSAQSPQSDDWVKPHSEKHRGAVEQLLGIGGERYRLFPERVVRGIVGGFVDAAKSGAELVKETEQGQQYFDPTSGNIYSPAEAKTPETISAASLGVSGAPGAAGALARPVEQFGEHLAKTYPERTQEQAVKKITQRFDQGVKAGGPTMTDAITAIKLSNLAGKPMTLADVGAKPVESLAGNVYRSGGEAQAIADKFLQTRDEGAAQRIAGDIAKYVHGGESMHRTAEQLLSARSAEGKPLWEQVRAMEGVWSPRLQQFIEDPVIRRGMARGYEIERLEALAENRPFDPTQMGVDLDAEGNIKLIRAPNMNVLHMAKVGLDAMIADERNEITGRLSARGVALDKARRAYLDEIDGLDTSGIYKRARAAWEGPSKSLDALRSGRQVFSSSPDEIAAEFGRLSDNDKEFYRLGVADLLRERLAKTGLSGDEAKSIIRNPWTRDQLKPIFRSEGEFNAFVDAITAEQRMFSRNVSIRRGSQTAERLAEDQGQENMLTMGGADIAKSLASGEWIGAIRKYIRMKRDLGIRQDPALNERIARILFSTEPDLTIPAGSRTNYLQSPANLLRGATPALIPGAASALATPPQ